MVNVFFADGFEEVEALTVVDMLRRAKIDVSMVSTGNEIYVTGSHNITVKCDCMLSDVKDCEMIVLPGGLPGVPNLMANEKVMTVLKEHLSANKKVGAICAAPWILGELEVTYGIEAICYPGFEDKLTGAVISKKKAVTSRNITTSKAAGTAMDFAFEIIKVLKSEEEAIKIKESVYYN